MTNGLTAPVLGPMQSSPVGDWLRVLGTLCLLLGIVWIGLYWLRERPWLRGTLQRRMRLRIEETRPIGNRSALHLVVCGEQQFLVGSSPAGVSLVAELMATEESPGTPVPPQTGSFLDALSRTTGQNPPPATS